MTAQAGERLIYNNESYRMASEPLEPYLALLSENPFIAPHTACWRGYFAAWKIENNKLYLIKLKGYLIGYEEVALDFLFPGEQHVFACWYTGELRVQIGKLLFYVHGGYESITEQDLYLKFVKGELVSIRTKDNREKAKEMKRLNELFPNGDF